MVEREKVRVYLRVGYLIQRRNELGSHNLYCERQRDQTKAEGDRLLDWPLE